MENIFVARQPIYNAENQVMAYELLYRSGEVDTAEFTDGMAASTKLILSSYLDIGFDELVGSSFAFINITRDFIVDESLVPMYEKQTVLEVLEDIAVDAEVIAGLKRLRSQGYQIALDDFQYREGDKALLELADYVKLDVLALKPDEVVQQLDIIRKYPLKVIAEKVETPEIFEFCKSLPFDYYQGFYFCKPQLVQQKRQRSNRLVVLDLLRKINRPDYDFNEIEKTLAQDATLTFKLLRYVNSAAFTQRKEIDSIHEALAMVGGDTIRKWTNLILMMRLSEGKPTSLLVTALVRARMCELLESDSNRGQIFTVGLLSLLDALMDQPLVELLDELALSASIKLALLDHEGENGEILLNVILYEQGEWTELVKLGVNAPQYFSCYMEAVKWADQTIGALESGNV